MGKTKKCCFYKASAYNVIGCSVGPLVGLGWFEDIGTYAETHMKCDVMQKQVKIYHLPKYIIKGVSSKVVHNK